MKKLAAWSFLIAIGVAVIVFGIAALGFKVMLFAAAFAYTLIWAIDEVVK